MWRNFLFTACPSVSACPPQRPHSAFNGPCGKLQMVYSHAFRVILEEKRYPWFSMLGLPVKSAPFHSRSLQRCGATASRRRSGSTTTPRATGAGSSPPAASSPTCSPRGCSSALGSCRSDRDVKWIMACKHCGRLWTMVPPF